MPFSGSGRGGWRVAYSIHAPKHSTSPRAVLEPSTTLWVFLKEARECICGRLWEGGGRGQGVDVQGSDGFGGISGTWWQWPAIHLLSIAGPTWGAAGRGTLR